MASQMTRDQRKSATDQSRQFAGVCGSVGEGKIHGCHVVEVGAREEAEHTDGVQPHQHANHQDQDEAQEGWRRGPMVSQAAATSFPASSTAPMMMMGQKAPAKIAVRPSMEKAADTQASAGKQRA
jgi:hypothetical protein